MAPLVPNCQWWTSEDSSIQAHMNALYAFFAGSPSHWSLVEPTTVVPGTNITSFLIEQGTAPNVQQVNIRLDAANGQIKAILTPNGTATTSTDTGISPVGFTNASGEVNFNRPNVSYSDRGLIAEYPDAILFLIEAESQNYFEDGGHFGIIYNSIYPDDEDLGLTGHGIVGGSPSLSSSSAVWFSSNNAAHTQLRIGLTASPSNNIWSTAALRAPGSFGLLNGELRFCSLSLETGSSQLSTNTSSNLFFGLTKYLRHTDNAYFDTYLETYAAVNSNQAWLGATVPYSRYFYNGFHFPWDKTIIP